MSSSDAAASTLSRKRQALHISTATSHSKSEPLLLEKVDAPSSVSEAASNNSWRIPTWWNKWLSDSVWPGMGLFGESYLLFSIGTLKPIWQFLFPDCFAGEGSDDVVCSQRLLYSLSYSVVLGVITGMLLVGYAANSLGRRRGSITTAALMSGAASGLALSSLLLARYQVALFRCMAVLLFIFGVGVGGEYPLAASSASENAMGEMKLQMKRELEREEHHPSVKDGLLVVIDEDIAEDQSLKDEVQKYRGRKIQLVFTMQGMGIFFNSLTMTALLLISGQTNSDNYSELALLSVWRITYTIGAAILVYVLYGRYKYLAESAVWLDDKRRREQLLARSVILSPRPRPQAQEEKQPYISSQVSPTRSGISIVSSVSSLSVPSVAVHPEDIIMTMKEVPSTDPEEDIKTSTATRLLLRNYGNRLLGVSLSWMLWDVAFYGNKLFQSSFLLALTGEETTLLEFALAATLNSAVALLGYFGAALIIDHPMVGRCRLQQWGFLLTGLLFVGCGFLYKSLSPTVLVIMYLGTSFFGQLGPNATTFLLPAEIFPTEMRTLCHGIAAASGKVGALLAAVMFNRVQALDMFLLSGYASFAACAITFWTIPETSGLDLYEVDRKWRLILDGRKAEYEGEANSPKYLSYYERNKLIFNQQSNVNHGLDAVH